MNANQPLSELRIPHLQAGCWPTADQRLLLHAALDEPEKALAAWVEWNRRFDIERDRIDIGSFRLLPLVYAHLLKNTGQGPHNKLLQGVYKRCWYENQIRLRISTRLVSTLQADGIDVTLLKGQALALRYYRDLGARPMSDIDLLVPKDRVFQVARRLSELGWEVNDPRPLTEALLEASHAYTFQDQSGAQLDLHWHALHYCRKAEVDTAFLGASTLFQMGETNVHLLCPTDQLLHVCEHGLAWNKVPPIRWITDALAILRADQANIDWQRLVSLAVQSHVTLQLRTAIKYLRDEFQADIPLEVLTKLELIPCSRVENRLWLALVSGGVWHSPKVAWFAFLLARQDTNAWVTPSTLLKYFGALWGETSYLGLMRHAMARTFSKTKQSIRNSFLLKT